MIIKFHKVSYHNLHNIVILIFSTYPIINNNMQHTYAVDDDSSSILVLTNNLHAGHVNCTDLGPNGGTKIFE